MQKMESRITKFETHHLSLPARIMIANSLILGCLWHVLIMWAGEDSFLKKLQRMVDHFIWRGRSRIARAMASLPKMDGGMGFIDNAAQ